MPMLLKVFLRTLWDLPFKCFYNNIILPCGHSEMTSQYVTRHSETNAGELPEVTVTAGGCGDCWKPWQVVVVVAGDARNMTENALSILIVIFPHNSNKLRPQIEICLFSSLEIYLTSNKTKQGF